MRPHAGKYMYVIRHAVYLQHFMIVLLKNTGNVLMQAFFPLAADQSIPVFYGKYKLNVDLGVRIRHRGEF